MLDPSGNPTGRLEVVKAADVARLTEEAWQTERTKMLKTCNQCHSGEFAKVQLQQSDGMIRDADHAMAEAIRTIAGLYQDGVLPKPKNYAFAFPDLLTFHDAPDAHRAEAVRHVPRAPHARVPGRVPREPGLRELVRVERDGARPRRDQGGGGYAPA